MSVPIMSMETFAAALASAENFYPGGDPLYLRFMDGGVLCFTCAEEHREEIAESIERGSMDMWAVTTLDLNAEDNDLRCVVCDRIIERVEGH